jgi:hypothetical protein
MLEISQHERLLSNDVDNAIALLLACWSEWPTQVSRRPSSTERRLVAQLMGFAPQSFLPTLASASTELLEISNTHIE